MTPLIETGLNVYLHGDGSDVKLMEDYGLLSCLDQIKRFIEFEPNRLQFLQFCAHPEKTIFITSFDELVEAEELEAGFVVGLFKTNSSTRWHPSTKEYLDRKKLKSLGFEIDTLATKVLRQNAHIKVHQDDLFCARRIGAPSVIPTRLLYQWAGLSFFLCCRGQLLKLRRLATLIPDHFRLRAIDRRRMKWKLEEVAKLKANYDFYDSEWQEGKDGVLATVNCDEVLYSFFDTSVLRRSKDIPFKFIEHWFELGDGVTQEVAIASSRIHPDSIRLNEIDSLVRGNGEGLVLSTMVFNDFMFIEPWIRHYRKYGVKHFLVYFNHHEIPCFLKEMARTEEDITLIPWGVAYSKSAALNGKTSWHLAQPMQLHHSEILVRAWNLGSHLLYVDIDEYIVGRFSLEYFVEQGISEIGFRPVWARSHCLDELPQEASLRVNPDFEELVPSKKIMRSLSQFTFRNIHGDRTERHVSSDHVLLHFGELLAQRSELRQFLGRTADQSALMKQVSELDNDSFLADLLSECI